MVSWLDRASAVGFRVAQPRFLEFCIIVVDASVSRGISGSQRINEEGDLRLKLEDWSRCSGLIM